MAKLKPEYINPQVQIKMFRTQLRGVADPLSSFSDYVNFLPEKMICTGKIR